MCAEGQTPTLVQMSLAERCALIELKIQMLDQKVVEKTFTEYNSKVYFAAVGALRRLYQQIGINKPEPRFASLLKASAA